MGSTKHDDQGGTQPQQAVIGRLEELNGQNGLTGLLREPNGTQWVCHFQPHHQHMLAAAWMSHVRVVGQAADSQAAKRILEVVRIELVNPETKAVDTDSPFRNSQSLEELAREQGVAAASNLDEISDLWPVDDDPDDLLRYVLNERNARRALASKG